MTALLLSRETPTPDAIVCALADAGIEYVLGMPGGYTGPIFSALYQHPTIRVIQVREEAIASLAAEAAARLSGKVVAVMGQGEWIVGNAGQGLLEALLGSSPVIVLTEMSDGGVLSHHGYYQSGSGDYGAWDARAALGAVTKRTYVASDPVQAVQMTQLAIKHATSGTPGPVAVVYHSRSLTGTLNTTSQPRLYRAAPYVAASASAAASSDVGRVAQILAAAKRPVIIAGNGVRLSGAYRQLASLAQRLQAPVATTAAGKGVYDETHTLSVGVMGTFGRPLANAAVAAAETVVAIGTRLAPMDTGDESPALIDPLRQTIVQIDAERLNVAWTYPIGDSLIGDAATVIEQVLEALPSAATATWFEKSDDEPDLHEQRRLSSEMPLHPQHVIDVLQQTWPQDGIITSDAGENRLFMLHWYRSHGNGRYLMPAGGGGMGYSLPAALGAKLVMPDRPVIAVVGDGGFAVSMSTLMTAAQEEIPFAVLVLNNAALGWVAHGMGSKAVAAHFMDFDHAAIAQSMKCEGVRVSSSAELRRALEAAHSSKSVFVIDVPTNLTTSFKDIVQPVSGSRWRAGE